VSLDEAIARAVAASEIGVDAVFVEAPRDAGELERVAREVPGVVRVANMVEGGKTPLLTPEELHALDHDLIVTPLTALFAATRAMRAALTDLRTTGTMRSHEWAASAFSEFEGVVDLPGHRALEARYADDRSNR
jgi:methylisocitrate lyase